MFHVSGHGRRMLRVEGRRNSGEDCGCHGRLEKRRVEVEIAAGAGNIGATVSDRM